MKNRYSYQQRQRGISLIVVMILVMAMALMTTTAMYMSQMQYKLVGNIQQSEVAFNEAEVALVSAESWLKTADNAKHTGFETYSEATPHLYPKGSLTADITTATWSDSNSIVAGRARYMIEQLAPNVTMPGNSIALTQKQTACKSAGLFRVVAKADSRNGGMRILETLQATQAC
jgi:Tfp pilus assembly protein PilX